MEKNKNYIKWLRSKVGHEKIMILFAGGCIFNEKGEVVTSGGRVIAVTAHGKDIEEARNKAYQNVEKIKFEGVNYRHDIGLDLMKL